MIHYGLAEFAIRNSVLDSLSLLTQGVQLTFLVEPTLKFIFLADIELIFDGDLYISTFCVVGSYIDNEDPEFTSFRQGSSLTRCCST
jgi:hypothetical protein